MTWETIIGLEVHVQLLTRSKMFCGCSATFGDPPNTHVCPVCLGLPGALPVPNELAVRLAVRAACALGCTVHRRSLFARKNYFYPDLPKGYQISQFEEPLATAGALEFVSEQRGPVTIGIRRLHLEEDAGKSFHDRVPGMTAVDFNRSGVPLVEIVSAPDLRSPAEARAFLVALKAVLRYLEVSDCNMEQGSLRVDANLSVRRAGDPELGTRTEVKNLNSFSGVERALAFERDRQIAAVGRGEAIEQRTMLFDASSGAVRPMRSKEESHDYRYFPEPDLPPLVLVSGLLEEERCKVGELPSAKHQRFMREYGVSAQDAGVLTAHRRLADEYEEEVRLGADPRETANWFINVGLSHTDAAALEKVMLQVHDEEFTTGKQRIVPWPPGVVRDAIEALRRGELSHQAAKKVLAELAARKRSDVVRMAQELGLIQLRDEAQTEVWVRETLAAHAGEAARYRRGETKLLGFLVGQVMKRSQGKADPKAVSAALTSALEGSVGRQ
ncbi:MAG: Asp-tRNA(Asn)/Glu-tRNA(Gln) amidotransferase subunit GatB [Gemmatimonadetes bacterium]|nr:Asp-tRNA(Asn)/Glu-tRNA(Gln) amidotransferase subunit GatB [Gemmatimonadota bacterium]